MIERYKLIFLFALACVHLVALFGVKLIVIHHFPRLPTKCCITIAFDFS